MPGTDERSRARIEDGWRSRGREDALVGQPRKVFDEWSRLNAASAGLGIEAAYHRGYDEVAGRLGQPCPSCPSGELVSDNVDGWICSECGDEWPSEDAR